MEWFSILFDCQTGRQSKTDIEVASPLKNRTRVRRKQCSLAFPFHDARQLELPLCQFSICTAKKNNFDGWTYQMLKWRHRLKLSHSSLRMHDQDAKVLLNCRFVFHSDSCSRHNGQLKFSWLSFIN